MGCRRWVLKAFISVYLIVMVINQALCRILDTFIRILSLLSRRNFNFSYYFKITCVCKCKIFIKPTVWEPAFSFHKLLLVKTKYRLQKNNSFCCLIATNLCYNFTYLQQGNSFLTCPNRKEKKTVHPHLVCELWTAGKGYINKSTFCQFKQ